MRLYIITVFALLSIAGTAVYYQCAKNSQRKAEVEQNQPSAAAIPAATHQPQTKDETANLYDAGKDCLYRLYLLATIAGVLVALGGIYAIWKQTEATAQATDAAARSAKAAEDSVKLQQSAQRQWVNLEKWNVSKVNTSRTLLAITFEIVNPTKVPLTLHYVITKTADRKTNTSIPASFSLPKTHASLVLLTTLRKNRWTCLIKANWSSRLNVSSCLRTLSANTGNKSLGDSCKAGPAEAEPRAIREISCGSLTTRRPKPSHQRNANPVTATKTSVKSTCASALPLSLPKRAPSHRGKLSFMLVNA